MLRLVYFTHWMEAWGLPHCDDRMQHWCSLNSLVWRWAGPPSSANLAITGQEVIFYARVCVCYLTHVHTQEVQVMLCAASHLHHFADSAIEHRLRRSLCPDSRVVIGNGSGPCRVKYLLCWVGIPALRWLACAHMIWAFVYHGNCTTYCSMQYSLR